MKYLITEAQKYRLYRLAELMNDTAVISGLDALKPIEPLSDKEIYEIVGNSPHVEGKYMLPFSFAREIEAHILGEKPEETK